MRKIDDGNIDTITLSLLFAYILKLAFIGLKRQRQCSQIIQILIVGRNFWLNIRKAIFTLEAVTVWNRVQTLIKVTVLIDISVEYSTC